jgi:hypothetical protein
MKTQYVEVNASHLCCQLYGEDYNKMLSFKQFRERLITTGCRSPESMFKTVGSLLPCSKDRGPFISVSYTRQTNSRFEEDRATASRLQRNNNSSN